MVKVPPPPTAPTTAPLADRVGTVSQSHVAPDGLPDIFHVVGQGIVVGASMVLVDFHPRPERALCDGPQALLLDQLPRLVEYVNRVRSTYEAAVAGYSGGPQA